MQKVCVGGYDWIYIFMLEKTLESPLDCKEIQPVHPKDQSWIFIGRTDAEAETPILWPPDAKSQLIGKDSDAEKDWRREEKRDDRGWDGWMASLTQWTWVWASSGRWWWTGRPGMLQSMGLQRVRHYWAPEQQNNTFKMVVNWINAESNSKSSSTRLLVFCCLILHIIHQVILIWNPLDNSVQFCSVAQSCQTLCNPMDCSTPGLPVHHQLPEFAQTRPLSWWCHPTISTSVIPFSSWLQSFPAWRSFQMSQLFA